MPKHEKRPAPVVGANTDSEFSDADLAEISEADLRQRSEALNEAQETWEGLAFMSTAKIPCPECGGRGTSTAGSFGDIECPNCHGRRVIERPGNAPFEMPPFAQLREAISAYGNARALRKELPPASSVPSLESIRQIMTDGVSRVKALDGAPGVVDEKLLKAPRERGADDEGGDFDDDELDQAEEANAANKPRVGVPGVDW